MLSTADELGIVTCYIGKSLVKAYFSTEQANSSNKLFLHAVVNFDLNLWFDVDKPLEASSITVLTFSLFLPFSFPCLLSLRLSISLPYPYSIYLDALVYIIIRAIFLDLKKFFQNF